MKIIIYILAAILLISIVNSKLHRSKVLPQGAVFENNNSKLFSSCYKDTQCVDMRASNQVLCDIRAMECRSKTRCSKSSECFTNHKCENTFCKSRDVCQSTIDCTADRICVKGKCKKTGTSCASDRVCPDGQYCHEGVCTNMLPQKCWYDHNCNPGSFCYGGKCIRLKNKKCVADVHCNKDYKCWYDTCRKTCTSAYDCPTNLVCDEKLEICKAPSSVGCIFNKDCPLGKLCRLGKCRDKTAKFSCREDSECKKNQICEKRFCISDVGGPCENYTDCMEPLRCGQNKICYNQDKFDDNGVEIVLKDK
jgi:hypothetical protein